MHQLVKDYYGKKIQSVGDLKISTCCDTSSTPDWLKPLLANIHPDVVSRYYGCGLVNPELLEDTTILDLGCGSGRDVYALGQLVGKRGMVVGVDMTQEQLDIALKYQVYHNKKFGYCNTQFLKGYIEDLGSLNLKPESFDVVVSNCVINLSPDKDSVLKGVYRLLKRGGELYFSDIYADRRVPESIRTDEVLYGECLGGALYWNDFLTIAKSNGFLDPRLVTSRPVSITDPKIKAKIGNIRFYSATYRLFKIEQLESECEDYGQAVIYKGSIPEHPDQFTLDNHHTAETGRIFTVCGNTWRMLNETRFSPHFEFIGNFNRHYGIFQGCGGGLPFEEKETAAEGSCGCG